MTHDDHTASQLVTDAVTARPLRRADDPDWIKVAAVQKRRADAWRVMNAAANRPDEHHTLDVWGILAGLKTAPHRRASDLRAAGMLVPVELGHTASGAVAMTYQCAPQLVERFRTRPDDE